MFMGRILWSAGTDLVLPKCAQSDEQSLRIAIAPSGEGDIEPASYTLRSVTMLWAQVHFGGMVTEARLLLRMLNTLRNPWSHLLTPLDVGSKGSKPLRVILRGQAPKVTLS